MSCLVQGHVDKKWQIWALKPDSPTPESTSPTPSAMLLPGQGWPGLLLSRQRTSIPNSPFLSSSPLLSPFPRSFLQILTGPPFVQHVFLSSSCQAGLERRQDS